MIDEPVAQTPTQTAAPKAKPATKPDADWKLEAPSGTLAPRSALDVLTSLNERVASGPASSRWTRRSVAAFGRGS